MQGGGGGGMDQMSEACDNYDLTVSTKWTEIEHQPASGKPYSEPTITMNGKILNHLHFSCLRKENLKCKWQDKFQDTEVLKKARMQSVHTLLKLAQLR